MTPEERAIARQMFIYEGSKRNGQDFENFFQKIMGYNSDDFRPVQAWGSLGDRKNDGFDEKTGTYYQVYAPKDLKKSLTQSIKKLNKDFAGLHKNWNKLIPIKEFRFVVNDKTEGIHPDLTGALKKLEADFKNDSIIFKPFILKDLERVCFSLDEDMIISVLGSIPSPNFEVFDVPVMQEVIEYLLKSPDKYSDYTIPKNPDFEKKLKFNNLSEGPSTMLKFAAYSEGALRDYFKYSQAYQKERLRSVFTKLYSEGKGLFTINSDSSNNVFFYILEGASKDNSKSVQNAVLILMAYYFGYCDIFEEPPIDDQIQLF